MQFLIVGIGASAGGLEAFTELLAGLPEQPGFAIVFVAHLSPSHESALRSQYTPIDQFFRSLAKDADEAAIAVILSGTSSDGSGGLRDVKGAGGLVFAQAPEEAKYDGMPRAAIATGLVDRILPAKALARELVEIARHPRARALHPRRAADDQEIGDGELAQIFGLLRKHTGVDFALYKPPTIKRRLQRRMLLQRVESLKQYIQYLEQNPNEVHALYQDILIHVTGFFREAESFEALSKVVFSRILENRRGDSPIRIRPRESSWPSCCARRGTRYGRRQAGRRRWVRWIISLRTCC
ncbi:MAG: chemotaxis protein CheB [Planctomycetota bacterium]